MAETQPPIFADSIRVARERLGMELRAQAEHILKLNQDLADLQLLHGRTEQEAARQWDEIERAAAEATRAAEEATRAAEEAARAAAESVHAAEAAHAAAEAQRVAAAEEESKRAAAAAAAAAAVPQVSPDEALAEVLTAVRALMTCTIPEQVFEVLTEETSHWGVRAAIFDVRGRAAWGASAHGFGPGLSEKAMHSVIVQLNQDTPFRQVCETAGPVDATAETLRKNRNVVDKLKPTPNAPILLLPIRSGGTVSAILYADLGNKATDALPVNALKVVAEFAGAQIDRLIALSGGFSDDRVEAEAAEAEAPEAPEVLVEAAPVEAAPAEAAAVEAVSAEPLAPEPSTAPSAAAEPTADTHTEAPVAEPAVEPAPPAPPLQETVSMSLHDIAAAAAASEPAPPVEPIAEGWSAPVETEPVTESASPPAPMEPAMESEQPPPAAEPVVETEFASPPPETAVENEPSAVAVEAATESESATVVDGGGVLTEPGTHGSEPAAYAPMGEAETAAVTEMPMPGEPMTEMAQPATDVVTPPPDIESAAAPAGFDVNQLSEPEQKVHKDAKRFAKLLVSEIDLYNKGKVAEGRKNGDLYRRLKSDIDRSRQTFDKRFGKDLSKQFDYFHDELVKTLAANDAAALGPEYSGPPA